MFVEPGIQVNPVEQATPAEPDLRYIELGQQRDADAQINGRLFLGQTTNRGQRQAFVLHCWFLFAVRGFAVFVGTFVLEVLLQVVG